MKKPLGFIVLLSFCLTVHAQQARVIPLSTADAAEAKRLYTEMQAASDRWEKFQRWVTENYAKSSDMEFDESFHFVVLTPNSGSWLDTTTGRLRISSPGYGLTQPRLLTPKLATSMGMKIWNSAGIKLNDPN